MKDTDNTNPETFETVNEYLTHIAIQNRSAVKMQKIIRNNTANTMISGTSAEKIFSHNLPEPDIDTINAKAKELVTDMINLPFKVSRNTFAASYGIPDQFMNNLLRQGILMNGITFGGVGSDVENNSRKNELVRFIGALGSVPRAARISKLMSLGTAGISEHVFFNHTGKAGRKLRRACIMVGMQDGSDVPSGGIGSITISDTGSVLISLRHNKGRTDQLMYSSEIQICLPDLDTDARVSKVKTAMVFASND